MDFGLFSIGRALPGRWAGPVLLLLLAVVGPPGCAAPEPEPIGAATHGLICQPGGANKAACNCNPGSSGGDLTCECTDNGQCNWFDNDTRLVICNVPAGGVIGNCVDCMAFGAGARPEGCACTATPDCSAGLLCNGRTCQALRARGEYCDFDTDCGSDGQGQMTCDKTQYWCGPQLSDYFCNFNDDCLTLKCIRGVCASGGENSNCWVDSDCLAGEFCDIYGYQICTVQQDNGATCTRNVECAAGVCNSFYNQCGVAGQYEQCTLNNPAGPNADCDMGLTCTDCGLGDGTMECLPAGTTTCM